MSKKKSKAMDVPVPATSPSDVDRDKKYQTDSDLRVMMDHHEMMADPERVKRIKKLVGRHSKAITNLKDLRAAANNYSTRKKSDSEDAEETVG